MRTGRHVFRPELCTGLGARIRSEDEQRLIVLCAPPVFLIIPNTSGMLGWGNGITTVAVKRRRREHTRVDTGLLSDSRSRVRPSAFRLKLSEVVHRAVDIAFDMP